MFSSVLSLPVPYVSVFGLSRIESFLLSFVLSNSLRLLPAVARSFSLPSSSLPARVFCLLPSLSLPSSAVSSSLKPSFSLSFAHSAFFDFGSVVSLSSLSDSSPRFCSSFFPFSGSNPVRCVLSFRDCSFSSNSIGSPSPVSGDFSGFTG